MSKFLTDLNIKNLDNKDNGLWVLLSPLEFQSDIINKVISVPFGFKTDLASVPRIPIIYELTGNTASAAAVIHDYLYKTKEVPKILADAVFREASKATGVPFWRRSLMWFGVRIFGTY